mmetsp:Transcript_24844/g.44982  ORF Transcript_24844/g.44982 Transcript_24844/m.44982 type:complete len:374 (-) Transcript_24844:338-1459(-)|eukprot:CAMPEP_0197656826 /NCGR_PEP_ID=MMETSP1338-20131121/43588_1 /TAXON_ID=43686 ORGANISM="Pelagodinium beii, Strain RCC1491" /NCGR_SAMPLE_ID=MMETSP1338 /ASSEMBLY_ACC=CAM_ASM_000754 /LENGTH=373 /DNA_ID=CAMNT_0043233023 /DNA_START=72 /DNA_END=1193 /DNA_ORIENTATION=+
MAAMMQVESKLLPAKARLVVKHTFLEFVNASPGGKAARAQKGVKTDSFLPEIEAPLPNEPSWALPNEPSGLSDYDTDVQNCCDDDDANVGGLGEGDDDWDADRLDSSQEDDRDSRTASTSEEGSDRQSQAQTRELAESGQQEGAKCWKAKDGLPLEPSAAALHALPAMTAAAAAAALEAASNSPEVLLMLPPRSLAKEEGSGTKKAVISVADALGSPPAKVANQTMPRFDPSDIRTTVMLRNLPNNYTRSMLIALLESEGFQGKFDFLYLPVDLRSKAGLGYAFVNLVDPAIVPQFWKTFAGYSKWVLPSAKVCHVSWSGPHQGQKAHLERYRNSPIMHSSVPDEFKPVVFSGVARINFPGPSKKLRAPRRRS